MKFIPLHLNSGYSFLKSGIQFEKLAAFLQENEYDVCGLTDLNVMYGFPSFNNVCKRNNINSIFGLDLYCQNNLFTLYVKNENGYKNLCQISTFLEKRSGFCEDFSQIKDFCRDLICVISTKQSDIFSSINEKIFKDKLYAYSKYFDDFYIGLEIYSYEDKSKANLIKEFATNYSYPTIAFPTIKYLKKEDYLVLAILKAIDEETTIEVTEDRVSKDYYLPTQKEVESFYDFKDIKELHNLVNKINFSFLVKRGELLHFTKEMNISAKDLLKQKVLEGLDKHNLSLQNNILLRNRLNKEFLIIDKMGYCDYFLIVQDYIKFAKDNNIPVGPGRGSVGGSLIAYLLDITEVNPLDYGDLLFERFLNPERNSMPDIDIDFSDIERDKVINYIIKKYTPERTARVIAFQTIGPKQAIRDVGRVLRCDSKDIDDLSKAIPSNFNQNNYTLSMCAEKIPAFKDLLKDPKIAKIYKFALLIEGFPRQKGMHAAGVIINDKSLLDLIPLTFLDENTYVTQYEKDYLEDQGFLKMDLLGLTALNTIQTTLNLIKKTKNIDLKISEIPFKDPSIFSLISNNQTMGIFQLDTSAANKGITYIKPANFNEIVDLLALDRPGPMEQIPLYARRKEKKEKVTYPDKSLIPILKNTYGIIVYQEQIMQIARVYAGFSYAEADIFRRAVSKKHKEEILKMKSKFVEGALKLKRDPNTTEDIFNLILKFASYGFNKSHSVPYSMISCRMAYLKAKFPLEFYCSILESQYGTNDIKFNKYLSEIRKGNIKVLTPNINESINSFSIYNNSLLMPLTKIGGLPSKVSLNIIDERSKNGKFESFIDFVTRMYNTKDKITALQISKLIDAGCFDSLNNNRKSLKLSIESALQFASTCTYHSNDLFDYGLTFNEVQCEDDLQMKLHNELLVLGAMISDTPFNYIIYDKRKKLTALDALLPNQKAEILGIIKSIKIITIKKGKYSGQPMCFVDVYDDLDNELSLTLFTETYALYQSKLEENKPIIAKGYLDTSKAKPSFITEEIEFLNGGL